MPGFEQPYRGQPRPHYPKPLKRFRNPKREKREAITAIVVIAIFFILIGIGAFTVAFTRNHELAITSLIVIFVFGIFLTASIADALYSVDKFRPHYDMDTSKNEQETDKDREQTKHS